MSKYFSLLVLLILLLSCSDNPTAVPYTVPWQEINDGLPAISSSIFNSSSNAKCIAFCNNNIIAGCKEGVYLSSDEGKNWSSKSIGLPDSPLVNIITVNNNNIFIGTEEQGVYLSTDNGNSWSGKNTGLRHKNIKSITKNGNYLYIGTGNGIFVSTDNGDSWAENGNQWNTVGNALSGCDIINIIPDKDDIYAASTCGIYRSSDNCNTWTRTHQGIENSIYPNCFTVSENIFYAGTNSGIILSTDKGKTWVSMNNSTSKSDFSSFIINCITIKGSTIFVGTLDRGVYISTDKGVNWKSVGPYKTYSLYPNPQAFYAWISSIVIHNDYVYITSNYGVYKAPLSEFK